MTIVDKILNSYDLMEYISRCGYTTIPVGSYYKLSPSNGHDNDSFRIDPRTNTYFHSSVDGRRRNVINFAAWHYGISIEDSIKLLSRDISQHNIQPKKESPQKPKEKEPLQLPEKFEGQYARVFSYLYRSRGIDPEIINHMIKTGMLYQDNKSNAVFVGRDKEKMPCFGFIRGTSSKKAFKGVCVGSDFSKGLYIGNNSQSLFVSEAVIDNLSLMTMLKLHGDNYKNYDYLATCGPSMKGLLSQVASREELRTIYLAFDNDIAGNKFRLTAREKLIEQGFAGQIIDKIPQDKDWNLDLIFLRKTMQMEKEKNSQNFKKEAVIL